MTAPQSKRLLSEAIYEQLMTDEDAPPSVRLQAAQAYDAIENGRPGIARSVNLDDIRDLDDDQCERLFRSLMNRIEARQPGFFRAMMRQVVDEMLAQLAAQPALPKPKKFHFVRGPLAGAGPEVPRWPPAPPAKAISVEMSPKLEAEAYAHAEAPPTHGRAAHGLSQDPPEVGAFSNIAKCEPPDNVVVMPGVGHPYGLRYGLAEHLPDPTPSKGNGAIHPDVVARSAHRNPTDPFDPWRRS